MMLLHAPGRYSPGMSRKLPYSSARVLSQYVLEALREPVVVLDRDGAMVEANHSARQQRRCDLRALLGEQRARQLLAELNARGRASLELLHERDAQQPEQLLVEGLAVEDWFVVSVRDVTQLRVSERELAQLRGVGSLGLLTASIVHDFNNLLQPMLGWTSLLASKLDQRSPAGLLAADIEAMLARAAALVRDVRTLAHSDPAAEETLPLNATLDAMRPLLERLFGGVMRLSFALDERVGSVRVARDRLEHALLNLLVNARNALPAGGAVSIHTGLTELVENGAARGYVSLAVSDTGCGMSEEVRAQAFDEFFTTGGSAGGTGLGLASVKRFASESGGLVRLQSARGEGTTVTLLFPRI
jgi:signal transduction histidine kinase